MSSNSEATPEDVRGSPTPTISPSSTTAITSAPNLSKTSELQDQPLLAEKAAKRLQEEDDRRDLFQHLPETYSLSHRLRRHGWSTLRYLTQTEVHTYAFRSEERRVGK